MIGNYRPLSVRHLLLRWVGAAMRHWRKRSLSILKLVLLAGIATAVAQPVKPVTNTAELGLPDDGYSQYIGTTLTDEGLLGPVKHMLLYHADYIGQGASPALINYTKTLSIAFNPQGQSTTVQYYQTGDLLWESQTEYDEAGHVRLRTLYGPDGMLWQYIQCDYDATGHLTRKTRTHYADAQTVSYFNDEHYSYNDSETLSSLQRYNQDGTLNSTINYTYNSQNRLIGSETLSNNQMPLSSIAYDYDDVGNLTHIRTYDGQGAIVVHEIFAYDDMGRKVKHKQFNQEGALADYKQWVFDDDAQTVMYEHRSNGELISRDTLAATSYDTQQPDERVATTVTTNTTPNSFKDPDQAGNWQVQITQWPQNSTFGRALVRQFSYYSQSLAERQEEPSEAQRSLPSLGDLREPSITLESGSPQDRTADVTANTNDQAAESDVAQQPDPLHTSPPSDTAVSDTAVSDTVVSDTVVSGTAPSETAPLEIPSETTISETAPLETSSETMVPEALVLDTAVAEATALETIPATPTTPKSPRNRDVGNMAFPQIPFISITDSSNPHGK